MMPDVLKSIAQTMLMAGIRPEQIDSIRAMTMFDGREVEEIAKVMRKIEDDRRD